MKKLFLGALALITAFSLVACGEKEEQKEANKPEESVVEVTPAKEVEEQPQVQEQEQQSTTEKEEEQVGVGNTDESMVALALEKLFKDEYGDMVEEVVPTSIKVYTQDEIDNDESIKSHGINEGDIVFDVYYELLIKEGVEDMNQFTAGTGEIDGQWIRNKSNVGILRTGENGYTLDAFGTGF